MSANSDTEKAIEDAYAEGWYDGKNTCTVDGYYLYDWKDSETKAALKTEEQGQ